MGTLQQQQALLGGIIVRRAAARVGKILDERHFDREIDRAVFRSAMQLAALGLDDGDEYVCRIAQHLWFQDRPPRYLVELMEAFEAEADRSGPGSLLEDLAHEVATAAARRSA